MWLVRNMLEEHDRKERYRMDLKVPCPDHSCGAAVGGSCFGLKPGIVHLGRRILAISREKGHRLYPSAVPDDES